MIALIRRWLAAFCIPAFLAVIGLIGAGLLPLDPAEAQVKVKRRSIIDLLFNRKRSRPQEVQRPQPRQVKTRRAQPTNRKPRPVQAAPVVEKLENATKVLVVGDFMAAALADGLEEAFLESPGVVVLEEANGSSGLVRDDFYDWPENLPAFLDDIKPSIVIVMVGSNDRQPMRVDGETHTVLSDRWVAEYTERVEQVASAIRSRNMALLWVGAPAYKSSQMSADILAFNGIFRSVTADAQGEFIDIWDGFVDENGKFIYTGSDIKGQQVRLRTSDGIRMTGAGRRKLAFYVEKPVRRLLGDDAQTGVAGLSEENLPELLVLEPDLGDRQIVRTQPIDMNDPELDGAQALLGATAPDQPSVRTPRDELVLNGITVEAPPGRADDFVWPPRQAGTAQP